MVGGVVLMGARLYNPSTGRFLTRDAVEGGNDNAYTYPADPINQFDLTGDFSCGICHKILKKVKRAIKRASEYDYGTALAGVVNVGWGLVKLKSGVTFIRSAALCNLAGPEAAALCFMGGIYQVTTGGLKVVKGARQLHRLRKAPKCKKECGFGGNAKRFFKGVIPFGKDWIDIVGGLY